VSRFTILFTVMLLLLSVCSATAADWYAEREFTRIYALDKYDRSVIANLGFAIDRVDQEAGYIEAWVPKDKLEKIKELGFVYETTSPPKEMPSGYTEYHDYDEQIALLEQLHTQYPEITDLYSIGDSLEGNQMPCLKISDNPLVDEADEGAIVIAALHHAREILSVEPALYAAQQLCEGYGSDEQITYYVDQREIFIVPNVNPDGFLYDHSGGSFDYWRKNRRVNLGSQCKGVDLNRNYGYEWGGSGSSGDPCDDTYRGIDAFSEPETTNFSDFVADHPNLTTLISLHTYSELILYPWGYTYDPIGNTVDFQTHQVMAELMAEENGYTPQQASDLYTTNGDTLDWAYGELGIICFTFELSPSEWSWYDFYPPESFIEPANTDNWEAFKIAIGFADDPAGVLATNLWKFTVEATGAHAARVEWASVAENDAQGWRILRSPDEAGPYEAIHTGLLPAGQSPYSHLNTGLTPLTTYFYKIHYEGAGANDVDFGPVSVTTPDSTDDDDDNDDDNDDITDDDDTSPNSDDDSADDDVADADITDDDAADDDAADDDAADDDTPDDDTPDDDTDDDAAADDDMADDDDQDPDGNNNAADDDDDSDSGSSCGC